MGGRPVIHNKHGKQSVWLTSELFEFKPVIDKFTGEITGHTLHVGSKKFPVGIIKFNAHHDYKLPASIYLSVHAGHWHVSFNYDNGVPEPKVEDTIDWLMQFSATELLGMTVGLDRGVNLPLAVSNGQPFDFSEVQQLRLLKQERHKKRWQHRHARRTPGSSGYIDITLKFF